jgi:N-acetylglucosamine kinase-like BadF-type ATPase
VVDDRVTQLVARLGDIHPGACCAGAAGAEVADGRARLDALLRRLLPDSRVCVVHDARLVLAAAGLESGIALIAGTGSVAYGRTKDGREAQRGGWGWMIGDEGSGAWITREAARLVMARSDAGHELGELAEAMFAACGVGDARQLILELHARHEAREWAALATTVFETADVDAGSREVISQAGLELAKRAVEVQGALDMQEPVVLAGGLLLNEPRLEEAVRKCLPDLRCVRLEEPPVEGAVRLAEELLRA